MPKRSNEFQRLIKYIETEYASNDTEVIESAMIEDLVHNTKREIDVLIKTSVSNHPITIGVECRDRKRKADVGWIDELIGKYQNLPIDKIVAVSRFGFYKNALEKAKKNRIEAITLEEALEANWIDDFEKIIDWEISGCKINFKDVGFTFDDNNGNEADLKFDKTSILYSSDGTRLSTAQNLVDWIYTNPPRINKVIQKEIEKNKDRIFYNTVTIGSFTIAIPVRFYFKDEKEVKYEISSLMIRVECRVEKQKVTHNEYFYNDKLLSLANVKMKDVPIDLSMAVIQTRDSKANEKMKWFCDAQQKET